MDAASWEQMLKHMAVNIFMRKILTYWMIDGKGEICRTHKEKQDI